MLSLRCKMILTNLHFSDFYINSMAHFIPAESLNCSKIQVEVEVQARAHKLPMQRDRPKAGPWPGTEHICPNPRVTSLLHVSILNSKCSLQWRFSSHQLPALPHPSLHLHSPQGPLCIARGSYSRVKPLAIQLHTQVPRVRKNVTTDLLNRPCLTFTILFMFDISVTINFKCVSKKRVPFK